MIGSGPSKTRATADGCRYRWRGFALLELVVSLVLIGLLASTAAAAYGGLFRNGGAKLATDARLVSLSESVIAFARTHNRLPCPDITGDGYEALVSDVCPTGIEVGWLPYLSIGLSQPAAGQRAIYGVSRKSMADLAVNASPATLSTAAVQPTVNTNVYLTGDGSTANGAENCVNNVASNPAFVILVPGEDRSGDGNQVDGIHSTMPGSGRCFSAPSRGADTHFDDRTIAVSPYAMLAKLNQ